MVLLWLFVVSLYVALALFGVFVFDLGGVFLVFFGFVWHRL